MGEEPITLTSSERECLVEILERALKEIRVEEHRTRTPSYREQFIEQDKAIVSILAKLGHPQK